MKKTQRIVELEKEVAALREELAAVRGELAVLQSAPPVVTYPAWPIVPTGTPVAPPQLPSWQWGRPVTISTTRTVGAN